MWNRAIQYFGKIVTLILHLTDSWKTGHQEELSYWLENDIFMLKACLLLLIKGKISLNMELKSGIQEERSGREDEKVSSLKQEVGE